MIPEPSRLFNKTKVLHVDDEDSQLVILKTILEDLDNRIELTSIDDPIQAVREIKRNYYDCIITDLIMPGLSGIELTKMVRDFSNIPIILYTGQGSEEVAGRAFHVGIDDYLMKELDIGHYTVLLNKIEKAVEKYKGDIISNTLLRSINDSLLIIGEDYKILYHNDNFLKYSNEEIIYNKSILKFIDKDSRKEFKQWIDSEESLKHENVLQGHDGLSYFIEVTKVPIREFKSKRILVIVKDVTSYKVKNDIKDLGEERFLSLVEVIPDGIMAMNLMGYVTYVNPAFCKITGFSEEEIIGSHMLRLKTMSNKDVRPYWNILKNVISDNKNKESFEFSYSRKDGSTGIGEAYVTLVNFKGKREFIGILKDITHKKMREEEYENIFKTSPDGIIHLDMDGNIKAINDRGLKIFGVDQNYILGKNILDFKDLFYNQEIPLDLYYEKIVSNKAVKPFEVRLDFEGSEKFIEMNASLIKSNNEKLGIQVVIRDITLEKEIQLEREKYTERLEELVSERTRQIVDAEKMAAIGKVSSMIAHDLKGPLQIINNSLHLIRRNPDDMEKYIEYISESVKRCNEMLIELSSSTKRSPLNKERVSMGDFINKTIKQLELIDKIDYEVDIGFDTKLNIDKSKFMRVFDNLLKNSVEAMPDGGKITIKTEKKKNDIVITVKDNGVGIPEYKIKNIFRPFQSTKSKGMGLGLVFCKNTIESHGGEITILSEQNKGTSIVITLPIEDKLINESYSPNLIKIKDILNTLE